MSIFIFIYLPVYFPASSLDWIGQSAKSSRFVDRRLRVICFGSVSWSLERHAYIDCVSKNWDHIINDRNLETCPQNCAFLLSTCMLSAEILKKNRRVISETCPFKHKHPRTLNCQHGIGKLPTYSCNVSSLHFNKTGYWNWSCLSLSTPDFTAPLMWQHTETSSTESMFFCETKLAILSTNCRPNCGSNVCYEWRSYWKHYVGLKCQFIRLYLINSRQEFCWNLQDLCKINQLMWPKGHNMQRKVA